MKKLLGFILIGGWALCFCICAEAREDTSRTTIERIPNSQSTSTPIRNPSGSLSQPSKDFHKSYPDFERPIRKFPVITDEPSPQLHAETTPTVRENTDYGNYGLVSGFTQKTVDDTTDSGLNVVTKPSRSFGEYDAKGRDIQYNGESFKHNDKRANPKNPVLQPKVSPTIQKWTVIKRTDTDYGTDALLPDDGFHLISDRDRSQPDKSQPAKKKKDDD